MTSPAVVLAATGEALPGLEQALAPLGLGLRRAPMLAFEPMDLAPLRAILSGRGGQSPACIAVTSRRAAHTLAQAVPAPGYPIPVWASAACRDVLAPVFPALTIPGPGDPARGLGLSLAEAMLAAGAPGPVLFPCGDVHREELVLRLRAAGRRVVPVPVYRSVAVSPDASAAAVAGAELVIATSPRIVALLAAAIHPAARPALVALGATTARAAAACGWSPAAVAQAPTVEGVAQALAPLTVQPASLS